VLATTGNSACWLPKEIETFSAVNPAPNLVFSLA